MSNRALTTTGAVLLGASILVPIVFLSLAASAGSFEEAVGSFVIGMMFTFIISPIAFIVGLILLISGLSRGRQQQQQQVVIHMAGPTSPFCTHCGKAKPPAAPFCPACGRPA